MTRLSIPARIFVAFLSLTVAFVGVSAVSIYQHNRTATDLQLLRDGYLPLAIRLGEARSQQAVFRTQVARALAEDGEAARWFQAALQLRPSTLRRIEYHLARSERLAERARRAGALGPLRATFDSVRQDFGAVSEAYPDLLTARDAGEDISERVAAVTEQEAAIATKLRQGYNQLQDRIGAVSAAVAERERQSAVTLSALTALALLLGFAITWWSVRLLRPLPKLQERVATLGQGDLSPREPISTREDELGRLAIDFEAMVAALAARDARLSELRQLQQEIVDGLGAAVLVFDQHEVIRSVNRAAADVLGLPATAVGTSLAEAGLYESLPALVGASGRMQSGRSADGDASQGAGDGSAPKIESDPATEPADTTHRDHAVVSPSHLRLEGQGFRHPAIGNRQVDIFLRTLSTDADPRILLVVDDVSDALETKARLIDSERLAAIGRMAAHVTHEVRNPLSSIGLNVEMLEDELDASAEEARALMRAIQKEIERLRGITEEYLRLARVPDPALQAEPAEDFLLDVAHFVRREMDAAQIDFRTSLSEDLPDLFIDEGQIRQALLNLLRNAQQAGGATIELSAVALDGGVEVSIIDEGAGIDEEDRERVFDPFYTTKKHGTGLGLPLTQQIVLAHGGRIRCLPNHPQGIRFALWLPAAPAETNDALRASS